MSGSTEAPAIQLAARQGLVDERSTLPLIGDDARTAVHLARSDRMSGLLAAAIEAGRLETDESTSSTITRLWHDQLRESVVLEALAVRTSRLLAAAGVDHRLTKGAAVAHLDYGDASLRPFGDVDMVVHPDHWSKAVEALTAAGHHRHVPPLPGDYDDRYGKGATLTSPQHLELDLHRRFAVGRFGVTSQMVDVFESVETVVIGGVGIPALAGVDRLLHACYHAVLGGRPRMRAFRDVAQLLLVTDVDWEQTFERATNWRSEAVVARGITESWRRLGLGADHPALHRARTVRISRRDAWALRQFAEPTTFRRQAITSIAGLPVQDLPHYLATMAGGFWGRRRRGELAS